VNVVDAQGRIVYGPPLSVGTFTVGRPFESTLYKWRVNVALTSAQELAQRAARRRLFETLMAGLSAIVVVLGILVILVAVARERKLSDLKSEFVANVSHDLKTPLSLVRMFGEMLQSGRVENEEKRRQYIQIIVQESERLGALIENVLDFARVERGRKVFDFAPGNLSQVVESAVEKSRMRAEQEGIVLTSDAAESLPLVNLDASAIELATLNLIDNAIKYAGTGQVVHVAVSDQGSVLQVSVTDQGPGILPEDRKRIFERFVRGQSKGNTRGSGIGLALVRQIAEAHGGQAWVEPSRPVGSTFFLTVVSGRGKQAKGRLRRNASPTEGA
jgi:two-component system phosphate regulon sensor histidine kinase PhoR